MGDADVRAGEGGRAGQGHKVPARDSELVPQASGQGRGGSRWQVGDQIVARRPWQGGPGPATACSAWPRSRRNLLYTAVTRGRKLVVLVGTKKAVAIAVRQAGASKRITTLKQPRRSTLESGSKPRVAGSSTVN